MQRKPAVVTYASFSSQSARRKMPLSSWTSTLGCFRKRRIARCPTSPEWTRSYSTLHRERGTWLHLRRCYRAGGVRSGSWNRCPHPRSCRSRAVGTVWGSVVGRGAAWGEKGGTRCGARYDALWVRERDREMWFNGRVKQCFHLEFQVV